MNFALSEWPARRIVSQESCVQRICELVPGALSARRLPSPITRHILRLICYRKPGLLQLPVLSSLATSLTFLPGKAGSIWLWSSICSPAPFSAGNSLTLYTLIWSSVPPHAPSSQAWCPGEQSFTPIAAANTPPPSPASCSPDMVCAKA